MTRRGSIVSSVAATLIASGAIVAACHNDVPGPTLPMPTTPEVSPQGPRPQPITPAPVGVDDDAGVPLPSPPEPRSARRAPLRRGEGLAFVPAAEPDEPPGRSPDAGVDDDGGDDDSPRVDGGTDENPPDAAPAPPDGGAEPPPTPPTTPSEPEPAPIDAGVSDVMVLPPVPDAGIDVVPDAPL